MDVLQARVRMGCTMCIPPHSVSRTPANDMCSRIQVQRIESNLHNIMATIHFLAEYSYCARRSIGKFTAATWMYRGRSCASTATNIQFLANISCLSRLWLTRRNHLLSLNAASIQVRSSPRNTLMRGPIRVYRTRAYIGHYYIRTTLQ